MTTMPNVSASVVSQLIYTGNEVVSNPNCSYERGQNMKLVQKKTNIEKARQLVKTLGAFTAGRYMAKRGFSIEAALFELLGTTLREGF